MWGDDDGEILLHPDEAVRGVIAAIFEQFAASRLGARGVAVAARARASSCRCQRNGYRPGTS